MRHRNGNQILARRLRILIPSVVAMLLLQGCSDYFIKEAHLTNNPMDEAIREGSETALAKRTREILLERFPLRHPIKSVRDYLEGVGAKCNKPEKETGKIICSYTQYNEMVFRTPIGEFPEFRSLYTFHIELLHAQKLIRNLRVCLQITVIRYRGTLTDYSERIEYPMECPEGQNKKGE